MDKIDALFAKYPALFPEGRCRSGFFIGEGWMPLVDQLCQDILTICEETRTTPPVVNQVKEKFAGLRFYYTPSGDKAVRERISDRVLVAESKSYGICETCGEPGEGREARGYYYTSCNAHIISSN